MLLSGYGGEKLSLRFHDSVKAGLAFPSQQPNVNLPDKVFQRWDLFPGSESSMHLMGISFFSKALFNPIYRRGEAHFQRPGVTKITHTDEDDAWLPFLSTWYSHSTPFSLFALLTPCNLVRTFLYVWLISCSSKVALHLLGSCWERGFIFAVCIFLHAAGPSLCTNSQGEEKLKEGLYFENTDIIIHVFWKPFSYLAVKTNKKQKKQSHKTHCEITPLTKIQWCQMALRGPCQWEKCRQKYQKQVKTIATVLVRKRLTLSLKIK